MISAIQKRLNARSEKGFTLIELLVVIIIIGILLAIAVPSYLGFRTRANNSAAQANIRAAIPAAETYFADNGTYVGMTARRHAGRRRRYLRHADGRRTLTATSYCLQSVVGGQTWSVVRPTPGTFTNAACA